MEGLILIGIIMIIMFFVLTKQNKKHNNINKRKSNLKGGYINTKKKYSNLKGGYTDKIINDSKKIRIKPYINNIKFHNHFRDLMTAIDNMMPIQKKVFNTNNIKANYENANYKECLRIAKDFIINLKNHINKVPNQRNNNSGWDETIPDPNVKSGWEKFTENLGIPSSIYETDAKNGDIFLIDIINLEQNTTKYETRYIFVMIIGKEYVEDQSMVKISVVKNNTCKENLLLEELNIVGYLSDYGDSNETINTDSLYNFNKTAKSDVINNHKILVELDNNFLKKMNNENNMYNITDDTRIFGPDLPSINNYESHKVTLNISEDMQNKFF